jgi:glucose-6-phosphate 1-epimerase
VRVRASASTASPDVAALQKQHGIPGSVEFGASARFNGLPTVTLKHACGSSAEIALFGACVLSWKQASGDEVLYVRPDAVFDKSKPISGGVPHCFPQFGPGKMQQHGFARNLDWAVASASADPNPDDRDPEVELVLTPNDYTRGMWPHDFKAAYSVSLHGETLKTTFRVQNTGKDAFDFTAALHTYIEVLSASKAKVRGLKGLTYLDKSADASNPAKKVEARDAVSFGEALVDSVYLDAPPHVELDVGTGAAVAIDADGWRDTVVWNPHLTMEACYDKFVCVENARAGAPVVLAPGESWAATADFSVVDL